MIKTASTSDKKPHSDMISVAKFEIFYRQYLNEKATLVAELPSFAKDPDELVRMYKIMSLMRVFDAKAVALQRTGKMGTYAGILGQEAISVAVGAAMQKEDVLCPSYRDYGAFIQRGMKLSDIFAYWGGDERGNNFDNPKDFPICVPIGTQCLHAAGVAAAFKLRKQKHAVVTTIGDGGTSQGDFYEAMNLAGDWNLPIVFVVNNNQWAISIPRKIQTGAKTIAQKAIAAGFEGIQVDGNDIIAMRATMDDALEKARTGQGPTLVEAITYRLCDHTTADDAKRYRDNQEVDDAWKKEPLIRIRSYLIQTGAWSDAKEQALLKDCAEQVDEAVNDYMNAKPQPPESMLDYLYETLPEAYEAQRKELMGGI